ncbi:MAG: esterase, partial [Anaerolineae bacterium]
MAHLLTTLGPKSADKVEMILPHEHIFVDVRPPEKVVDVTVDAADVVALMAPEIEKARAVGVTALVECSPVGVGRRVDLVRAVSEATDFPVVVPTGIYREPWVPAWAHTASKDKVRDWMLSELQDEIEDTGVQAAWIK